MPENLIDATEELTPVDALFDANQQLKAEVQRLQAELAQARARIATQEAEIEGLEAARAGDDLAFEQFQLELADRDRALAVVEAARRINEPLGYQALMLSLAAFDAAQQEQKP